MRHPPLWSIAAASMVLWSCSKPPAATPAGDSTASAAATTPIAITLADYSIAAPSTLPAGYHTFQTNNVGKELHQAALVRLDSGKTYADFVTAMKADGPPPRWIVMDGGPQNTSEVSIDLTPGNYVWYCVIPGPDGAPHIARGMSAPMTVTPDSLASNTPPASDIDVTMRDYQWDLSTPITAGYHTLKVIDAATQPHEMVIVRLPPGKHVKDVINWVSKPTGPPPAESVQGIAAEQPGQVNYVISHFTAGNYALICFLPDASDGKPHAMHGMVKEFTVQ